jgi:MFS family permease
VLGVGAAMLWTAQGRLVLEWSDGTDAARLYGIFWSIFNCSALFGGLLSFVYFSSHDTKAPTGLFIGFLALIFVGSACVFLLAKPPGSAAALAAAQAEGRWQAEAVETVRLFGTRKMLLLGPLFWYTGFNQPYQLNTFGNRMFSARTLGLELIVFYGMEASAAPLAPPTPPPACSPARTRSATPRLRPRRACAPPRASALRCAGGGRAGGGLYARPRRAQVGGAAHAGHLLRAHDGRQRARAHLRAHVRPGRAADGAGHGARPPEDQAHPLPA